MIAEHGKKPVPNNRKGRTFQVLQSAPQGGEQEMIPAGEVLEGSSIKPSSTPKGVKKRKRM